MFRKIFSVGDKTNDPGVIIRGTVVLVRSKANLYFRSILARPNLVSTTPNLKSLET